MIGFLEQNIGTIVISAGLIAVVALAVRSLIKDKKKGKSSCGGNCGSCSMGCACHSK
ncbi:Virus attachment protein p12 family protein [Lachnospiraceae bacterium YSD2013]|nr:Virus attachment protein p12 family protein [Lachnospiraceae bacterium YSD2013]